MPTVARTVVRSVLGCATGGTEGGAEGGAGTGEEDGGWTGEGGNGNERDGNIAENSGDNAGEEKSAAPLAPLAPLVPLAPVVVEPLLGRVLIFFSFLEHEVLPAHAPRLALTTWFSNRRDMAMELMHEARGGGRGGGDDGEAAEGGQGGQGGEGGEGREEGEGGGKEMTTAESESKAAADKEAAVNKMMKLIALRRIMRNKRG